VLLRNCPFDTVATAYPDIVCGMNLAILNGLITGLRTQAIRARLAPEPGRCCVVIAPGDKGDPDTKIRWPRARLG
jgi:predicted ArsR family transcriptional regulator